ncbi:MAG: cyclic-di-AMP receptor [Chloroflexota bacterium]
MKMIVAILQDQDRATVMKALGNAEFEVTLKDSIGAYFRRGNTTLFIKSQNKRVSEAVKIIKENCHEPDEHDLKRGSFFVLNIEKETASKPIKD